MIYQLCTILSEPAVALIEINQDMVRVSIDCIFDYSENVTGLQKGYSLVQLIDQAERASRKGCSDLDIDRMVYDVCRSIHEDIIKHDYINLRFFPFVGT